MAVRHRAREQRPPAARPAPAPSLRLLSLLLGVIAVIALLLSIGLFIGDLTTTALVAAAVCVAAGWGRNRLAARAAPHE